MGAKPGEKKEALLVEGGCDVEDFMMAGGNTVKEDKKKRGGNVGGARTKGTKAR